MRLVLDPSVAVELIAWTDTGRDLLPRILSTDLHAPQLMCIEVANVLRSLARAGRVGDARAAGALEDLLDLGVRWHDCPPLTPRIWELRHNISAYDAAYVALADALDCRVLTLDATLRAAAPGRCIGPDGLPTAP